MRRKRRAVCLAVFVAVVVAGRGWWRVTHTTAPAVTNWSLATGEDDVPMVSRHEDHLAAVLSGQAGQQVYADGRIYPVAGRVIDLSLVSGGRHAVWTVERDGRRQGVLDGRATAWEVSGRAVVTAAGELAYQRADRDGRWLVVGRR